MRSARDHGQRSRAVDVMSRWERILDQKPQDLRDYVLDKVAGQRANDERDFPPRIEEWLDEGLKVAHAKGLGGVMAGGGRPGVGRDRGGCGLAREEMLHEYELIDRFCRSEEYRRLLPN